MRKRALWVVAGFCCISLTGCLIDREHNRRHWESFKKDLHQTHRMIDRHFFNFDEDDPDRF